MAAAKTKPNLFVFLRSALRSASRRYPTLYEALAAAKEPYKGKNPRQKYQYRCASCNGAFSGKEVSIDHIVDCGTMKDWGDVEGFVKRLFCNADGLQVLCSPCHDVKTYQSKTGCTAKEARAAKAAIEFCKKDKSVVIAYLNSIGYSGDSVSNATKRRALVEAAYMGDF